jgi:insulysin
MGICIDIQSLRDPVFLESRVEAFFEAFGRMLKSLSEKEFHVQKEGLIVKKLERLKNLREESSRFWHHISSGYYDFVRRTPFDLCTAVQSLTATFYY